jgi:hypothetical protein
VPAERAFSKGKALVSDQRASLVSETIQALQCLKDWLQTVPPNDIESDCNVPIGNEIN